MTYKEGLSLLREHVKNEGLVKHCIAAGIVMRELAKKFDGKEDDWELAGLLHDIDWEETQDTPEKHSLVAVEYLEKTDCPPEVIEAIRVHNHVHGFEPKTPLEKALYCAEELTGVIVACALVQPDKKLASVKPSSVIKKFYSPSFARGVDRDVVLKCEQMLQITLEDLVETELKALQARGNELEL